jgi:hypothetical protein
MDGPFFNDLRPPFIIADQAAVTLAATMKALVTPSALPVFGGQYWWTGKKVKYRLFGKITTVLTPGNGQFGILYGTGADANGVTLQSSAAFALTASQTNLSWCLEFVVSCRSTGNVGTLFVDGKASFNEAVAAPHILIPASAAVVSGACDLTAALIISPQFLRSGSTAETMTVQDLEVTPLN